MFDAGVSRREGVLDGAFPDLFHRDAFQLVGTGRLALDARHGAATQLLGALRRDVNEEEAAGDGGRRCVLLILHRVSPRDLVVGHSASLHRRRSAAAWLLPEAAGARPRVACANSALPRFDITQ